MGRRGINRGDSWVSFSARLTPWYELVRQLSARHPAVRRLIGLVAPSLDRLTPRRGPPRSDDTDAAGKSAPDATAQADAGGDRPGR